MKDLKEFDNKIKNIQVQIDELQKLYNLAYDYKLIVAILNKLNIDKIEITEEDLENAKFYYIAERDYENKVITVTKENN